MADPVSITAITATFQTLINQISVFVGGIFGIYLILLFLRWWEYRTLSQLLIDIKTELRHLNEKLGHGAPQPESSSFTRYLSNLSSPHVPVKRKPRRKKK